MLYRIMNRDTSDVPKHRFLKHSKIAVTGLNTKNGMNPSDTSERGYTTGAAYMNSDRKYSRALARSLYLVVIEETISPSPVDNNAIQRTTRGSNNNLREANPA